MCAFPASLADATCGEAEITRAHCAKCAYRRATVVTSRASCCAEGRQTQASCGRCPRAACAHQVCLLSRTVARLLRPTSLKLPGISAQPAFGGGGGAEHVGGARGLAAPRAWPARARSKGRSHGGSSSVARGSCCAPLGIDAPWLRGLRPACTGHGAISVMLARARHSRRERLTLSKEGL